MHRTIVTALLLLPISVAAQETASDSLLTVDHYLDWEQAGDPQISPDGSQIIYTRRWVNKLEDKWESALWIMNADGSHQRFLVKGSNARWSPDGTRILYLADGEPKGTQVFGRWMDAEGAVTQLTRAEETPADPRWTPDGKTLVLDGLRDTTWDGQYRVARIYALDVATGAIRGLVSRPGFWADPAVSPDGRTIAFTGYDSSEHTHRTSDLYAMGIDGSGLRDLSKSLDRDPGDLTWASDGKAIYFTAPDRGAINVHVADLAGGLRDVTQGTHVVSLSSVARNLTAVGVESDPTRPPPVGGFDLRKPQGLGRVTHVNDDVLANKPLARADERRASSSGGTRVQGWVVKPPSFDATKRYPLILEIHGGPFAMYNVGFSYMFQNFAANGYVVLYTNRRGGTGYGDAFSDGLDHNYPGPDYDDLVAGVDAVIGKGYVDTTRMYVSACSGGGVLSSWVIGHTNRFAAAAVRCPVIDWIGMAGQTDIPLFTFSFFRQAFWDKPDEWLAHSSLMYVGRVTTPTLLMTGELDRRTPIPQTEEYYAESALPGRAHPSSGASGRSRDPKSTRLNSSQVRISDAVLCCT